MSHVSRIQSFRRGALDIVPVHNTVATYLLDILYEATVADCMRLGSFRSLVPREAGVPDACPRGGDRRTGFQSSLSALFAKCTQGITKQQLKPDERRQDMWRRFLIVFTDLGVLRSCCAVHSSESSL